MATYPRQYGSYVLLERVGTGGMSLVDLACRSVDDASFVRFVVIKRVVPENLQDGSFLRMFSDEARINAELHHANVAQVYDFGKHLDPTTGRTEFFLAMEYVPGMDLRAVQHAAHRARRRLPTRFSISVMADVLEALHYAHDRRDTLGRPMRIVHRDINPRNIMLSVHGEVKVIDFGVALAADRLEKTQGQNIKGKFAYMAPEQIEGSPLPDGRADLFAVGLTLHELLAGSSPFRGLTELQIMHRILQGRISPLPPLPDHPHPQQVQAVLDRALAVSPEQRYPDAATFRYELLRAAEAAGGACSAAERAQFLVEVEPERVKTIQQRLKLYRESYRDPHAAHQEMQVSLPPPPPVGEGDLGPAASESTLPLPPPRPPRRRWPYLGVGLAALLVMTVLVWAFRPREDGNTGAAEPGGEAQGAEDPVPVATGPTTEPPTAQATPSSRLSVSGDSPGTAGQEAGGEAAGDPATGSARGGERPGSASGASASATASDETPDSPGAGGTAAPSTVEGETAPPSGSGEVSKPEPVEQRADAAQASDAGAPSKGEERAPSGEGESSSGSTGSGAQAREPTETPAASTLDASETASGEDSPEKATGSLHVTSRPLGLEVYVDGHYVGRTMLRGVKVAEGEHEVEVRNPGRAPCRNQVVVKPLQVLPVICDFEEEEDDHGSRQERR